MITMKKVFILFITFFLDFCNFPYININTQREVIKSFPTPLAMDNNYDVPINDKIDPVPPPQTCIDGL